jgi:hypothetical protein
MGGFFFWEVSWKIERSTEHTITFGITQHAVAVGDYNGTLAVS